MSAIELLEKKKLDIKLIYDKLKKNYLVKDLIHPDSEFIFILESPHKAELKHECPVAGSSGKAMSKVLFGELKPIGILLKDYIAGKGGHELLQSTGIMNISQIPLQRTAYPYEIQEKYSDFFDTLEKIRTTPEIKHYKQPEVNELKNLIEIDFNMRLAALLDKKILFIPCGKFAQNYYENKKLMSESWSHCWEIPHPARNQWSYYPSINTLKAILFVK